MSVAKEIISIYASHFENLVKDLSWELSLDHFEEQDALDAILRPIQKGITDLHLLAKGNVPVIQETLKAQEEEFFEVHGVRFSHKEAVLVEMSEEAMFLLTSTSDKVTVVDGKAQVLMGDLFDILAHFRSLPSSPVNNEVYAQLWSAMTQASKVRTAAQRQNKHKLHLTPALLSVLEKHLASDSRADTSNAEELICRDLVSARLVNGIAFKALRQAEQRLVDEEPSAKIDNAVGTWTTIFLEVGAMIDAVYGPAQHDAVPVEEPTPVLTPTIEEPVIEETTSETPAIVNQGPAPIFNHLTFYKDLDINGDANDIFRWVLRVDPMTCSIEDFLRGVLLCRVEGQDKAGNVKAAALKQKEIVDLCIARNFPLMPAGKTAAAGYVKALISQLKASEDFTKARLAKITKSGYPTASFYTQQHIDAVTTARQVCDAEGDDLESMFLIAQQQPVEEVVETAPEPREYPEDAVSKALARLGL